MSMAALAEHLRARGFSFLVESRCLRVRPASALTAKEREAIRANLPALLAHLARSGKAAERSLLGGDQTGTVIGGEPWDLHEAVQMMAAADAIIGRIGVDGQDPEIIKAVARVVAAFEIKDLETVRFACSEMAAEAHRLAARAQVRRNKNEG